MSDDLRPVQPGQIPAPLRRRRWVPVTAAVGGALVAGLLVGGTALAATSGSATPTTSTAEASGGDTPAAPTDGTAPAPRAEGPRGGPGAGRHGPGGSGGPNAAVPDGATRAVGTTTAVNGSSLTVRTDEGQDVSVTLGADTRYRTSEPTPPAAGSPPTPPAAGSTPTRPAGSAADLATGQRVEVTAKDGTALEVGIVRVHVGGTVLDASGKSATVITRDGLHVTLDLSGTGDTVTVGQQVRATGTASSDGRSVLVSSVTAAVR